MQQKSLEIWILRNPIDFRKNLFEIFYSIAGASPYQIWYQNRISRLGISLYTDKLFVSLLLEIGINKSTYDNGDHLTQINGIVKILKIENILYNITTWI